MLEVVVVEHHHHALEHIHASLRRFYRRNRHHKYEKVGGGLKAKETSSEKTSWTMVHFDSHPDLAVLNRTIPAVACFRPNDMYLPINVSNSSKNINNSNDPISKRKTLYEMLDLSQGGIAEWILPLVLAGNLNRIVWMKGESSDQFENGTYNFHVGCCGSRNDDVASTAPSSSSLSFRSKSVQSTETISNDNDKNKKMNVQTFMDLPNDAHLCVSLCHPYYLDDNNCCQSQATILQNDDNDKMNSNIVNDNINHLLNNVKSDNYSNDCIIRGRDLRPSNNNSSIVSVEEMMLPSSVELIVATADSLFKNEFNDKNKDKYKNGDFRSVDDKNNENDHSYQSETTIIDQNTIDCNNKNKDVRGRVEEVEVEINNEEDNETTAVITILTTLSSCTATDTTTTSSSSSSSSATAANSATTTKLTTASSSSSSQPWILDICLDCFACSNPFLVDIEQIDSIFTKVLVQAIRGTTFESDRRRIRKIRSKNRNSSSKKRKVDDNDDCNGYNDNHNYTDLDDEECSFDDYGNKVMEFRRIVENLFLFIIAQKEDIYTNNNHSNHNDNNTDNDHCNDINNGEISSRLLSLSVSTFLPLPPDTIMAELYSFYSTHEEGVDIWARVLYELRFLNEAKKENDLADNDKKGGKSNSCFVDNRRMIYRSHKEMMELIHLTLEHLPHLLLPHDNDAPHSQAAVAAFEKIKRMGKLIRSGRILGENYSIGNDTPSSSSLPTHPTPPLLVIISRSAEDGYTPPDMVEEMQSAVLEQIHATYCNCCTSAPRRRCNDDEFGREDRGGWGSGIECACRVTMDYGEWEGSVIPDR